MIEHGKDEMNMKNEIELIEPLDDIDEMEEEALEAYERGLKSIMEKTAEQKLKGIINEARKLIEFHYASDTNEAWEFIRKVAGDFKPMCNDYLINTPKQDSGCDEG